MLNHHLPKGATHRPVDLEEMFVVAQRLNHVLLAEHDLLAAMKLREIAPLHGEKIELSARLDQFQRAIANDNSVLANTPDETRERLYRLASELAMNIEENMRLTAIAQTVNQRVMKTFVEVLVEQQQVNVYSNQGLHGEPPAITVSLNINERA